MAESSCGEVPEMWRSSGLISSDLSTNGLFDDSSSPTRGSRVRKPTRTLVGEVADAFEWSRDLDLTPHLEERGLLDSSGHLTIAGALFLTEPGPSMRQNKAIIEVRRYPEGSSTYDPR